MTNTNGHGERVALYIRVSTDEQAEHGYSIPEQRHDLLAHVEREGWRVVDVIVDDGYSGSVGVRPGLDRVTRLAEAGEIDAVLAKKRNRFFRDRYIRMGFERQMREYDVRLMALDDAGHRFADAMMDEFSDWFRDEVTKNTVAGRMQKARQGKLVGSRRPTFGFEFVRDEHGKPYAYEVVSHRMETVRRVLETVARVGTVSGTRRALEGDNVLSPPPATACGARRPSGAWCGTMPTAPCRMPNSRRCSPPRRAPGWTRTASTVWSGTRRSR